MTKRKLRTPEELELIRQDAEAWANSEEGKAEAKEMVRRAEATAKPFFDARRVDPKLLLIPCDAARRRKP